MPYKVVCRCRHCHLEYDGIIARKKDDNPPCPNRACASRTGGTGRLFTTETRGEAVSPIAFDPGSGVAPSIGGSTIGKAVDMTAELVMADHKMTDLQTNLRPGDTMAPKLAPHQQARADAMFSGGGMKRGRRQTFNQAALLRRINEGALSPQATGSIDIVGATHAARIAAPVTIMTPQEQQQRPMRGRPPGY